MAKRIIRIDAGAIFALDCDTGRVEQKTGRAATLREQAALLVAIDQAIAPPAGREWHFELAA
jgi:hypothetical protein